MLRVFQDQIKLGVPCLYGWQSPELTLFNSTLNVQFSRTTRERRLAKLCHEEDMNF
jgi:hypothetical protein